MIRTADVVVVAALLGTALLDPAPATAQPSSPPPAASPAGTGSDAAAADLQPERVPTVGSLVRDLGNDFRQLPRLETAVTFVVGGGLSLVARPNDINLTRRASASEDLDGVFQAGNVLGNGAVQFGGAFAVYALGRANQNPRVARLGADLVRAQIVNTTMTLGIKHAVRRERPDGGRYSFPSGHTSAVFASATVLQRHLGWKAGAPAYGLAAYAASARLHDNQHFLSDVIFGATVGIVAGRTVTVGRGRTRFAVTPIAAPGGVGVGLTLVQPDDH